MSEVIISRRGGENSKILNLDKPPIIARSNLTGELTGSAPSGNYNYDVKINGTKIFSVKNRVPDLLGITKIELACTSIAASALYFCSGITSLFLPACTTIWDYGLDSCNGITSLFLPACTTIKHEGCAYCAILTSINLPACVNLDSGACADCPNLSQVTIGSNIQTISENAFVDTNSHLVVNIDRKPNAVSGAPWGNGTATIHWTGDV